MIEIFAARGGSHGHHRGRGGPDRDGFGDDGDGFRVGRLLNQGDFRLLVLALIEKQPSHGYEIIKQVEEMTGGAYAPSPGVIYPTLTFLEEAGFAEAKADGNKKRYALTDAGREHVDNNRRDIEILLQRLAMIGEKARHFREFKEHRRSGRDEARLPRSVEAAFLNLREEISRELESDETAANDVVRLLLKAAEDLSGR